MLIPYDQLIKKYKIKPKGVLHCGSSWGQEAEAYYANGVQQTIWIEAIPRVFNKLKKHVSHYPNVICLNACISDVNWEEVTFNISSNDGESSSMYEPAHHKTMHKDVLFKDKATYMTRRVDSLIKSLVGFDFLNIDLQCAELAALRGMGDLLNGINYAYIELNKKEIYCNCPLYTEVIQFMEEKGFVLREIKWVKDQFNEEAWGDGYFERIKDNI